MHLSPDEVVLWQAGWVKLNLTIVTTWALMAVLAGGAHLVTRRLSTTLTLSRWQNVLEIVVLGLREQIVDAGLAAADRYLPFIGTLFLFVALANLCAVIPGYVAPTGSLSTSTALALTVFVAVPAYGIAARGLRAYLAAYLHPTPLMLPFNVIGEFSRTLALAVRLFGNMMSSAMIAAILLVIAPLFFPVLTQALGLLTGMVQAYIFSILATVYIAAATRGADGGVPANP